MTRCAAVVWIVCGYHELAIPYSATECSLSQMHLELPLCANIRLDKCEVGYTLYMQPELLPKLKAGFETLLGVK